MENTDVIKRAKTLRLKVNKAGAVVSISKSAFEETQKDFGFNFSSVRLMKTMRTHDFIRVYVKMSV